MMMRDSWMYRGRRPITVALLAFFSAGTTVSITAQDVPGLPAGLPGAPVAPPPPPRAAAAVTAAPAASAPTLAPTAEAAARPAQSLNFRDAPIDQVLEFIADLVGRTLIKSPGINAQITIKSNGKLPVPETLQALEAALAMNNITLVPMGEKFLKVVQTGEARTHAMPLSINLPEQSFADDDKLISQVVQLKYVELAEVQPILETLKRAYGKIQALERTNSLLITDTQGNIKRMLEILEYLDQPAESQVETRIYELRYAEASTVSSRLNELIADSQSKEEKPRVDTPSAPPANTPPTPPGVIRAPRGGAGAAAADVGGGAGALEQAERGIIRGKVKIIADERTNIMFVISRPENFAFFDKIVAVLDRPVDAAIGVRVVPLEYAKAEDLSGILNEFIGAASAEKKTEGTASAAGDAPAGGEGRSTELRNFLLRQTETRLAAAQTQLQQEDGKGTIGRLSASTKILADKRTNSLLLMGRKGDLDALELVLDNLDIMLAQVLIETVILEVNLGDTVETGFDWLQRSVTAYNEERAGPGGLTVRTPVFSFGGGSIVRNGNFRGGDQVTRENNGLSTGGLTTYATFNDLNLDVIIRLAGSSSDARVLSTPVVMTTDNTEAKIVAAEERPVVNANNIQTTGQQTQTFEYRTIGITITVTPRINPAGFVMMEINQNADEVLGETTISSTTVPIIGKREISAQVGVQSRQTVVLGGLVRTDNSKSRTKVPVLGDLPLLGWFFRADTKRRNRTELLVLLTPYVLKTPQEALEETQRLYSNSKNAESGWHKGWSDSVLPRSRAEQLQEQIRSGRSGVSEGAPRMRKQTLLDSFSLAPEPQKSPAKSRVLGESMPPVSAPINRVAPEPVAQPEPTPGPVPTPEPEPANRPPSSADDVPSTPVPL